MAHSYQETALTQQYTLLRALFYIPNILVKYIHYRGPEHISFNVPIPIPNVPLIPYNDEQICCLLTDSCATSYVIPLGIQGHVGIPYIIKSEERPDLIMKVSKIDKLESSYQINPPTSIASIDSKKRSQCLSNVPFDRIRYIASDEFTNETLIAYVLNYIAAEAKLPPLFVCHYQGAVCTNEQGTFGLNIMENCDLGSLDKLPTHPKFSSHLQEYEINDFGTVRLFYLVDAPTILQILTQITVGLHMLQTHAGFVSGDLKAGNIFIKSDPLNTEYQNIKLTAPFTCKIADYGKSSCMLPDSNGTSLRFYTENIFANIYLKIHPFVPDINVTHSEYYYSIGSLLPVQLYTRTRHMGIPFYRSFDYYTMLVSMLTHPSFYFMFFSTTILRETFWDPLWETTEDSEKIMKRVHNFALENKGKNINNAIDMLKGVKLKCGAIDAVMTKLQRNII